MSEIAERLDDDKQSSKNSMSREMSNESENQSHPPTLTHNDYTVGWICALPKEFAVAVAMVDQIHPDLPSMPGDTCTYRVGSIGKHNVVIACLPKGGIGNNPAAVVAIQIKRSFSSIRVGLMVGIGGGIPTKVKLGDVVISTPVDVYLGVVQWNLDKTEKNETFKRTGALNSPPKALLTAVSTMEGMNTIKECEIPRYLEEMGKKWPKSVQRYSKPLPSGLANSNNDWNVPRDVISVLWGTILALLGYLLGWEILAPTARGGELAGSDGDQEQQEEIVVHYGLIPSGNQVIKNAKCRDKINERVGGNVLCIEMEAAGLMKDFPCIVIRGICDYTDEQKNKNWQEYAAAVAAACAKELLGYVQPSLVAEERPLRDILSKVDDTTRKTKLEVQQIRSKIQRKEDLELLCWLSPDDYGKQQSDILKLQQPGTGRWFLQSGPYKNWRSTSKQTLFCPGIPGAGKTIMTAMVIDDLCRTFSDSTVRIAYIYCNFNQQHKQGLKDLVANLTMQLIQRRPSVPDNVRFLYEMHMRQGTKPSFDELSKALSSVVALFPKVFIIVDALDEAQSSDGRIPKLLSEIFKLQREIGINFFATSRPIPVVENEFKGCLTEHIGITR